MCNGITDCHMHVVPDVDDGAVDTAMALEMLDTAYAQGVRTVYATSHNAFGIDGTRYYKAQFERLREAAAARHPDLRLYTGCELLCEEAFLDRVLTGLETGLFLPLGDSRRVLTEFYPDVMPQEALHIVRALADNGWVPTVAHVERYPHLFDVSTVESLLKAGAGLQVNVYSLQEEHHEAIRQRARLLVGSGLVYCLGSDAHRTTHRPPRYEQGLRWLEAHCDRAYVERLCCPRL